MHKYFAVFILLLSLFSCQKKASFSSIEVIKVSGESKYFGPEDGNLCFTFLSPECPLSENYTKTLLTLDSSYGKEYRFYYVFSGKYYAMDEIKKFYRKYGLREENILLDEEYTLAHYFEASITPEVFLTESDGSIIYSGAIDNWAITLGRQRQVISEHYLENAMQAFSAGLEVEIKRTKAIGCLLE